MHFICFSSQKNSSCCWTWTCLLFSHEGLKSFEKVEQKLPEDTRAVLSLISKFVRGKREGKTQYFVEFGQPKKKKNKKAKACAAWQGGKLSSKIATMSSKERKEQKKSSAFLETAC